MTTSASALEAVRAEAAGCTHCELYEHATQTVFGEGPPGARIMLVGEQPGDREDIEGRPFVGPAGRVLDDALERAGLERADVFVTNVVKHFRWQPRGKRRIHQKPNLRHVRACLPWLEEEARLVEPEVLVLLGATAAQALLGAEFKVSERRGRPVESPLAPVVLATIHPSAVLRQQSSEARKAEFEAFAADIAAAARLARSVRQPLSARP